MMLAFSVESARAQNSSGPQGPEEGVIRRQSWLIPAQDRSTMMWTTVFRPPGAGAFPLAVINHGSTQNELRRAGYAAPQYTALTEWLIAHGYAVAVPQRPGHGKTGGTYYEDQGGCANADFRKAGLNTAASIAAAIDFMIRQPFIRKHGVIAIGQSAGGWGVLALASQHYPPVKAVIAFAPGRGGQRSHRGIGARIPGSHRAKSIQFRDPVARFSGDGSKISTREQRVPARGRGSQRQHRCIRVWPPRSVGHTVGDVHGSQVSRIGAADAGKRSANVHLIARHEQREDLAVGPRVPCGRLSGPDVDRRQIPPCYACVRYRPAQVDLSSTDADCRPGTKERKSWVAQQAAACVNRGEAIYRG
jgi:dienelactone hydrolase